MQTMFVIGGLQAFDYAQVVVGNKTPGDNTYGEDKITIPTEEGKVPCLMAIEVESRGSATDADEDLFHLATNAKSAIGDVGDADIVAKMDSGAIIAIQPKSGHYRWMPPALIPLTRQEYYFGIHVQNGNEVKYRIYLTYRFIKDLVPQSNVRKGQF